MTAIRVKKRIRVKRRNGVAHIIIKSFVSGRKSREAGIRVRRGELKDFRENISIVKKLRKRGAK